VRGRIEEFRSLETTPIALTPDGVLSIQVFWASLDWPFPVLVDPGGAVAATFGAVVPKTATPDRATVLVDLDGRVLVARRGGTSPEEILRSLRAAATGITLAF